MDKKGLLLFVKFVAPVSLRCGCTADEKRALLKFILTGQGYSKVSKISKKFQNAFSYLKKIAQKNHLNDPFNYKVVEAYFLGNNLLTSFDRKKIPFHLTVVTKSVSSPLDHHSEIDDCRISWGKILKIGDAGKVGVEYWPLTKQYGKLRLGPKTKRIIHAGNAKVEIGDYIAIHHGLLCHCLTPKQLKQLKLWTDETLKNI